MEEMNYSEPGLVDYVVNVISTKAGLSFSPWGIGGAYPFFRPRWVDSFEKAENWNYDSALLAGWIYIGPGSVLLDREKGEALWHQFQSWSRGAQGGVLQRLKGGSEFFCFRPDRGPNDRVKFIVEAPIKIQIHQPKIIVAGRRYDDFE